VKFFTTDAGAAWLITEADSSRVRRAWTRHLLITRSRPTVVMIGLWGHPFLLPEGRGER
jgi:hypothetical protein